MSTASVTITLAGTIALSSIAWAKPWTLAAVRARWCM